MHRLSSTAGLTYMFVVMSEVLENNSDVLYDGDISYIVGDFNWNFQLLSALNFALNITKL